MLHQRGSIADKVSYQLLISYYDFFSDVSETDNDYIYTYKDRNVNDDHDAVDDDYVMSMAVVMIMMVVIR